MEAARARELLEGQRRRLEEMRNSDQLTEAHEQEQNSTQELSYYDNHLADLATDLFEREKELSILEHIDAAIEDIDAALERLAEGTYGRCVDCGEPIPDERLETMPAARRCVRDQAQVERLG